MTNADIENKAPGCFGAASVFSRDSDACKLCVAFTECAEASLKTLQAIRGTIDVSDVLARHEAARLKAESARVPKVMPTPPEGSLPISQPKPVPAVVVRHTSIIKVNFEINAADQAIIETIPNSKSREQAVLLCKQGLVNKCRELLPKGINPFGKKSPAYLRLACDLILSGPVTKAGLKAHLMKELSWTSGTGGSQVAIAFGMLVAFQILKASNGAFVLNPALADHHV